MEKMDVLKAGVAIAGTYLMSTLAFTHGARREIGFRDNWECQNDLCIGIEETGFPRSFKQFAPNGGYMVQAAHEPDLHQSAPDDNIEHGRITCTCCHIQEEVGRGNMRGAKLLYNSQTIRNNEWIQEHGHDEKESFEYYESLAEGQLEG